MRIGLMIGALAAALMLAGTANAAECEAGKDGAKLSRLGGDNLAMNLLMGSMLSDPMKDGSLRLGQAKKLPKVCDRGDFLAGKGRYRAYGQAPGKKGLPIRYALPEDGKGPIAYLIPMSDEDVEGPWMVVTTEGDEMTAFAKLDAVPDDDDLRIVFAGALDGRYPRTIGLNLRTRGVTQYVNADDLKTPAEKTPKSSPEMPKPPPGTGAGEAQVLAAPDGVVFRAGDGGAFVHGPTGFACPAALNGYSRGKVIIFDAAEGGRDVACQLQGERGWMTVYLTKVPGGYSPSEVFATYSEQARARLPPKRNLAAPWTLPANGAPGYADFWVGPKDQHEGMWVMISGPWYIKLRVTYFPDGEAAMVELAKAVSAQVAAQVKPPEI